MSGNPQLIVGPHSKSTLIRSNSSFETGHITLNNGISIPSGNLEINNDIISSGSLFVNNIVLNDGNTQTFQIGNPTTTINEIYPDLGITKYNDNIKLGITSGTIISDAIQKTGEWLDTYLIKAPPKFTLNSTGNDANKLFIKWNLPEKLHAAFDENISLPHISNIKIEYVESSLNPLLDFSHPSTTVINTFNENINEVQVFIDGTTGFVDGTIYKEYSSIISQTLYDFRIYPENYSSTEKEEDNYLIVQNISTEIVGPPDIPTGITFSTIDDINSIGISWTKPDDHNISAPGDQYLPYIDYYGITYNAISSTSYNGLIADSGVTQTQSISNDNSDTNITITDLNYGTNYSFDLFAKNTVDNDFSTSVNFNAFIPEPFNPGISYNISFPSVITSPFTIGGYDLSGTTSFNSIVNYNNINGVLDNQIIQLSTIGPIDTFFDAGNNNSNVSTITLNGGIVGSSLYSVSKQIDGFGFPNANGEYNDVSSNITLGITFHDDYHINDDVNKQGFWKALQVYAKGNSSFFVPSSTDFYRFNFQHLVTGVTTINSDDFVFAIDDINTNPVVSDVGIFDINNGDVVYISGVPSFTYDTQFKYRFNIDDLGGYFLRNDKSHFTSSLSLGNNENSYGLDDINGITHYYYEKETNQYAISSTLHNTSGLTLGITDDRNIIQFNTFDISLGTTENIYSENLYISITGNNLYGSSNGITGAFLGTTGIIKDIRVDLDSINLLNDINLDTGDYGRLVTSGTTEFPDNYNVDYGITYDHSKSLVSEYTQDLQLINGLFRTPNDSISFLDYTNKWFPETLGINTYDYSSVSIDSNYKYTTFLYKRSYTGTINKVNIQIINSNITDYSGYKLYLRVHDPRTLNPGDYSYQTSWLSCNDYISWIGVHNADNGGGCLDLTNTTSATDRICWVKSTSDEALFFIKIGFPNNSNLKFEKILFNVVSN